MLRPQGEGTRDYPPPHLLATQPGKMIWEENRRAKNQVEVERLPRKDCFCQLEFVGERDVDGKQDCLFQQGIPMEASS